jgi:hypothetical protein
MTPHLLDLEKCVPPEGNLFVLVIPFYYLYHYTSILSQIIPFWDALHISFGTALIMSHVLSSGLPTRECEMAGCFWGFSCDYTRVRARRGAQISKVGVNPKWAFSQHHKGCPNTQGGVPYLNVSQCRHDVRCL